MVDLGNSFLRSPQLYKGSRARMVVWSCHVSRETRRHFVCHQSSTLSPKTRSAVSSFYVGHHDPERTPKDLTSIEFACAAGQDVMCSGLNVSGYSEGAACIDLLATVCDNYPRFAEKWPNG